MDRLVASHHIAAGKHNEWTTRPTRRRAESTIRETNGDWASKVETSNKHHTNRTNDKRASAPFAQDVSNVDIGQVKQELHLTAYTPDVTIESTRVVISRHLLQERKMLREENHAVIRLRLDQVSKMSNQQGLRPESKWASSVMVSNSLAPLPFLSRIC